MSKFKKYNYNLNELNITNSIYALNYEGAFIAAWDNIHLHLLEKCLKTDFNVNNLNIEVSK